MNKLFWIDLEMTGLDVTREVILEVAVVITDLKFNSLDAYHAVLRQPQEYLDRMDEWNQSHHKASGLLNLVASGKDPLVVEDELVRLVDRHFKDERAIIAGNSIAQDRLFIDKYFTTFSRRLHYRMLDVSSWKIIFNNIYQRKYQKKQAHRAIDDIHESIDELKFYLSFVQV